VEPILPDMPSHEDLAAENARLRQQNAALSAQVADVTARLEAALAEIDRLKRSGKRQATPFSTGQRAAKPKKPGRKKGQGKFTRRPAPPPESYTREVPVPLTETACPDCGGQDLRPDGVETVTVTDLPAPPPLEVTAFHLETCRCGGCGKRLWATHPEVPPDQRGATAHRLGPRVLALAHWLHYQVGVPVRKVPTVLATVYGVVVTQSALTQDALRRAQGKVGEAYAGLRKQLAHEPAVNTDDTGWKVGGTGAFLMGFFSLLISYFQIRPRHRNEEVREVIPSDYGGTLGTDRGRSYEAKTLANVKQQKCLAHIQRSLTEALAGRVPGERLVGRGRHFCLRLKELLREAVMLWESYRAAPPGEPPEAFVQERQRITDAVTEHLRPRKIRGEANRRLLSELGWHHDQGNLLRFLTEPETVEPTNNRAERGLRPAVIARKVSHCSKNWDGAQAHAAFMSVLCTLRQRGVRSPVEALVEVFRTGRLPGT
jgi:transposase